MENEKKQEKKQWIEPEMKGMSVQGGTLPDTYEAAFSGSLS
ncbi:hypothetical protein ADIS_2541 [Lunatimonas lonarensis]|uniref:Uncharacterized protein n=1 Tax=Lunatimonas lonarensis TaxID=1232681 RepID=R7ZSH2_9BACT|nr:hypothetical protein [Lunatimonas lonarensis]EON76998.1 hypothetical protein ADIS_2541 [Lunatimonas lonarensis]